MQLTITVKDGATNKDIANQLRWQAGLIEGMSPKDAASRKNTDTTETTGDDFGDGGDFTDADTAPATKKSARGAKKQAAAASDDFADESDFGTDAAEETTDANDDFADEEAKPAKTAKGKKGGAKKVTIDDVNDACKTKAAALGADGRKKVLNALKKNFGVVSVTELKEDQYADVIKKMAV